MFGEFIKQIRARQRLGLREFCLKNGYDPSNWSKIERGVLPPPRDEDTLRTWAKQLGLKQGSDDWLKFCDYAAVDSGRIPDYVLKTKSSWPNCPCSSARFSARNLRVKIWKNWSNSSEAPTDPERPAQIQSAIQSQGTYLAGSRSVARRASGGTRIARESPRSRRIRSPFP